MMDEVSGGRFPAMAASQNALEDDHKKFYLGEMTSKDIFGANGSSRYGDFGENGAEDFLSAQRNRSQCFSVCNELMLVMSVLSPQSPFSIAELVYLRGVFWRRSTILARSQKPHVSLM